MKHFRQKGGWFQCSQNGFVVLLVHENSTGQHGENARILFDNFSFLQPTDLQDHTLPYDILAHMGHGFMEVVRLGDHKMVGGDSKLQGSRNCCKGFFSGEFNQHGFLSGVKWDIFELSIIFVKLW
jgi:hypothetical protein